MIKKYVAFIAIIFAVAGAMSESNAHNSSYTTCPNNGVATACVSSNGSGELAVCTTCNTGYAVDSKTGYCCPK